MCVLFLQFELAGLADGGAGQQARRREQDCTGVVGDFERDGGGALRAAALEQDGPPRGAELLRDGRKFS